MTDEGLLISYNCHVIFSSFRILDLNSNSEEIVIELISIIFRLCSLKRKFCKLTFPSGSSLLLIGALIAHVSYESDKLKHVHTDRHVLMKLMQQQLKIALDNHYHLNTN